MRAALHWLEYFLLRFALAVAASLPLHRLRAGLEGLALAVLRVDWRHRRIVQENLRIAYPAWRPLDFERAARRAFTNWGRIAAELAHVDELLAQPRDVSYARLDMMLARLARRGRGVLVLSAHCANFELLARMAGHSKREMVVFHRPMSNPHVNGFLVRERLRAHVGTLGRGGAVREALRVLKRGGVIVAPMDQNQPAGRGIFVDLFGKPACTSTFLARLSLLSGAPVLPVFAVWRGDAVVPVLGDVIEPPARGQDRRAAVEALTERYTREIETAVRSHPLQWNWAHRRWKTRPEDEPRWIRAACGRDQKNVARVGAVR